MSRALQNAPLRRPPRLRIRPPPRQHDPRRQRPPPYPKRHQPPHPRSGTLLRHPPPRTPQPRPPPHRGRNLPPPRLTPLLRTLASLHRNIAPPSNARPFRIGLGAPLLNWWLSPRLPALAEAFPHLVIEILTWDTPAQAARTETDLALLWVPTATWVETPRERAFPPETVFPVAAPNLLATAGKAPDWRTLPLLAKGRRGDETGPEWSWTTWLAPATPPRETMRFREIGSAIQAAQDGNGVTLARSLLVADALRQRRLLPLVPPNEARLCSKRQIARWPNPNDQTAARMATWLVAAATPRQGPQSEDRPICL